MGELYNLNMFSAYIMMDCINMFLLIYAHDQYECLHYVLSTVVRSLDKDLKEAEAQTQLLFDQGMSPAWIPEPVLLPMFFEFISFHIEFSPSK